MIKVNVPRLRKRPRENSQKYADWCIDILKKYASRPKKENEQYNALSLYCNNKVDKYLHDKLDPMIYLAYSPKVNDTLKGFKIYINEEEIITEK